MSAEQTEVVGPAVHRAVQGLPKQPAPTPPPEDTAQEKPANG